MDKIRETRWKLEHAIINCYSAGENAEQAFSAKDQAWSREAYTEAEERHREAMAAADTHVLAVLAEAEAVVRHYFPGNESILEEFRALRGRLGPPECDHQWVTSNRPDVVRGSWCANCGVFKP